MTVGDVVAEDEEAHGNVVVGGGERTAAVLHAQDLEVVDDAVGDGLAAVGAVAAFDGELLFVKIRLLSQGVEFHCSGEFLEFSGFGTGGGTVFDDVAGGHVLKHFVGIPRAFDDEVAIVVEPFYETVGVLLELFGDGTILESFDGHEGQPGVGILFHRAFLFNVLMCYCVNALVFECVNVLICYCVSRFTN